MTDRSPTFGPVPLRLRGLQLTDEVSLNSLAASRFVEEVVRRGSRAVRTTSWSTDVDRLGALAGEQYVAEHRYGREVVVDTQLSDGHGGWSGYLLVMRLEEGGVAVLAAADSDVEIAKALDAAQVAAPVAALAPDEPRVPVTFWSWTSHGPQERTRKIDVPFLDDIAANYPVAVAGQLAQLAGDEFVPGAGGQLMLWHGEPGTGKTWALRALASEWRDWCSVHYITDPDRFFGDHSSYMLDVLLHGEGDSNPVGESEPTDPRGKGGRWQLLVCEDTGELMAADAKDRTGQALSRLLNVVDGLIGQGLRFLVLVTTNEVLQTLHPAVQRPGRCAVNIEFAGLPRDDARQWLADRGYDGEFDMNGRIPVADLFAVLAGTDRPADKPVGFAG